MKPGRLVLACAALAAAILAAAPGGATSLPTVPEGPQPGPPALYAPAATTPILGNTGRWDADPIMVSGAADYREGEFVYQDYLFDDYGANSTNAPFAAPQPRPPSTDVIFGSQTGDVVYPTDGARFAFNAADLVELRIDADATSIAYRFTLNTLVAEGSTAIAVGIDADGGSASTDWGHGLGSLGPLGVDHVLYTDGTNAEWDGTPVAVSTSLVRNQIEVVVPRSLADPGTGTWPHYAVTGIADGAGGFAALAEQPTATQPGGAHGTDAPPVLNVAFRFETEGDEPMGSVAPGVEVGPGSRAGFGFGHWREHGQALALAGRNLSELGADVDFGAMASGTGTSNVPETGYFNRIYVSALDLGEGVAAERPWLLGKLQPYGIYVPTGYDADTPAPLQLILHSLSCTYNQFQVFSPNIYRDLAEERDAIAFTTMGRGPDGWYIKEAELDVFDVWADVARNYTLDPDRVGITGYSMGGYGTYRLGARYPDLFGKAFPVVGPPGEGIWPGAGPVLGETEPSNSHHVLDNFRNVPLLIWDGAADELVPVTGTTVQSQRLDDLRYRYLYDVFVADHFALATVDEWDRGKAFLGSAEVDRNPAHVTYRVMPGMDAGPLGLVADHAYWVWDVEMRSPAGSPPTGLVDARSLAFGTGDPPSYPALNAGIDPLPYAERGRTWGAAPPEPPLNALQIGLTNVSEATFGLARANIDATGEVGLGVVTDGSTTVRVQGAFPAGATVVDALGMPVPFTRSGDVISIPLATGTHALRVIP